MQMLQEEADLLQTQKDQIEKSQKILETMNIHKIDDIIFKMNKEKQKIDIQEEHYQQLLSEIPDTEENKD